MEAYAHFQTVLAANLGTLTGISDLKALFSVIMEIEDFLSKSKKDKGDADITPLQATRDWLNASVDSPEPLKAAPLKAPLTIN